MSYLKLIIGTILLIGLGILITMSIRGCKAHKQVQQISAAAVAGTDTGKHSRDRDSIDHFTKQVVIANDETAEILWKSKYEKAAHDLGVSRKQVTDLQTTVLDLQGRAEAPVKYITLKDATGQMPDGWQGDMFTWGDSSVTITGYVERAKKLDSTCTGDNCEYVEGKATIFYDVTITVTNKKYWRRKHKIFGLRYGKKIYYIDASSDNKNIHITGLSDLQINN